MPIGTRSYFPKKYGTDDPLLSSHIFSEKYREEAFVAWYNAGKPRGRAIIPVLPLDENERKPEYQTIMTWRIQDSWEARAERMDLEVSRRVEEIAIAEKVRMFERHAEIARQLQTKAMDYLAEAPIDKVSDALKMLTEGVRIEKESRGVGDAISKVSAMSDQKLERTIQTLLGRVPNKQRLLESDTGEDEDMIDAEYRDEEDEE